MATAATITVDNASDTISSVLAGATTSLTKLGNGTLVIPTDHTYTGGTNLTAGTLNINSVGVAATSGPLGNGGTFTINGGTIDNTSGSAKVVANVNPITLGGDFSFSTSAGTSTANNLTLPGAISMAADRTITLNGLGALTLSGLLTNTSDSVRTLTVNNGTGTGATSLLTIGSFNLTGPGSTAARTNIITGTGNVTITGAVGNGTTLLSGLTKSGAGTLTLSGNNTYTGATTVSGGTLILNNPTSNGFVAAASGQTLTINNGGTVKLGAADRIQDTGILFVNTGGTFNLNGFAETIARTSQTSGGTVTNTGTLATLKLTGTGTNSTTAVFAGALNLSIQGASVFTLNGTSTYSGSTIIGTGGTAGTKAILGSSTALPSGTAVTVDGSGSNIVLDLNGFNATIGLVTLGSNSGGGQTTVAGTGNSKLTLTAGATLNGHNNGAGLISVATLDLNGATQTFSITGSNNASSNLSVSSVIQNGALTYNAGTSTAGALILSGANTYSGATTSTFGVIKLGNNLALQNSAIATAGTGTYTLNAGITTPTLGGLNGSKNLLTTVINTAGYNLMTALTLNPGTGATNTYSGVIANSTAGLSLTKTGLGTQTLANTNTYAGGTNVNAGTLLLSGAFNMPTTGTLTVNAGGNFSLADGTVRNTSAAALNLANGASLTFDWSSAGTVDKLTSTAAATTTGNVAIFINPVGGTPTGTGLTLLSAGSGLQTAGGTKYLLLNNNNFSAALTQSDTAVTIGNYAAFTANLLFWQGNKVLGTSTAGVDNALNLSNGTASNWSTAVGAYTATGVVPGSTADVIFSTTDTPTMQSTVLAADMTVQSVTFNDGSPVTIAGSNTLALTSGVPTAGTGTAGGGSAITVTSSATGANTISARVALGASQTWNIASPSSLTVSGSVSGAFGLTKADAGTLTLSGANTYTGATGISAGTLSLSGSLTGGGAISTTGSGILNESAAGVISGTSTFAQGSSGTSILDGPNTHTGGTTISTGTLQATVNATQNALGTGAVSIAGGSTLLLNDTQLTNTAPAIANVFTGTGLLKLQFAANITARNTTMAKVTGFTGTIRLSSLGTTGDKWSPGALGTVNAALIIDSGNTYFCSTGASTFSNGITVSGTGNSEGRGALRLTQSLGGNITLADSATIGFEGGTLHGNITSGAVGTQTLTLGATGSTTGTLSGIIGGGTGTIEVTKGGITTSTVTLSNINTYAGATNVNAGTLAISGSGTLGTGSALTLGGGQLDLGATTGVTVAAVSITAPSSSGDTIRNGSLTGTSYAASNTTGNAIVSASLLANGAAGFAMSGAGGTVTLSGTNTYTGGTTVSNGTLAFSGFTSQPSTGTLAISGGAIANLSSLGAAIATTPTVGVTGAGSLNVILSGGSGKSNTCNYDLSGFTGIMDISGSGRLLMQSPFVSPAAGAKIIVGNGSTAYLGYVGTTTLACTVQLNGTTDDGENLGQLRVENNAQQNGPVILNANSTIGSNGGIGYVGGVISDGALGFGFTKQGSGTLALTNSNTYTGATTLSAGTLSVGATANLGTAAANLVFDGGTLQITGTALTSISGIGHTVSFNAGKTVGLDIDNAANIFTVDQVLNQTSGGFSKLGAGTAILNQINTYSGATSITAGTLKANSTDALGDSSATNTLVINGSTLQAGAAITSVTSRGATFTNIGTIDTNSFDVSIAGNIGGTGTLYKTGAGTLTLSGTNSFTHTPAYAEVQAGTLLATKFVSLPDVVGDNWYAQPAATLAVRADDAGSNGEWTSANLDVLLGDSGNIDAFTAGSFLGVEVIGANTFTYANDIAGTSYTPVANTAKGLVKLGTGTLSLTGTNTYTGATTVSAGTLSLAGGSQKSPVTVSSGASLQFTLGASVTSTSTVSFSAGSKVKIVGTPAPATSYTLMTASSFAGITPVLDTPITGFQLQVDGGNTLKLVPVAGGYASWKATNAPTGTPGDDYDGDGVTNAVEYILGGTKDTNDLSKLPSIDASGSNLVFTFKRDQASIDGTTTVAIQVGTTLASWPDSYSVPETVLANNPGVTVEKDTPAVGTDTVTLRVVKAPDAEKFARLVVTPAP